MKRIWSYNVNGIRSVCSKGFLEIVNQYQPDIICLQEIKASAGQLHEAEFEAMGYYCSSFSAEKKGYSGVAIFSKVKPDLVKCGMSNSKYDVEGRVIRADFGDISVISAYFPSGTTGEIRQGYKMDFLSDFHAYLNDLRVIRPKLIISGDYNICRLWIDIHNPDKQQNTSGFLPEERMWFAKFIDDGYIDTLREMNQAPKQYSWWSYRSGARQKNLGWRIDYHIVSSELKDHIINAGILPEIALSDHCPVFVDLNI